MSQSLPRENQLGPGESPNATAALMTPTAQSRPLARAAAQHCHCRLGALWVGATATRRQRATLARAAMKTEISRPPVSAVPSTETSPTVRTAHSEPAMPSEGSVLQGRYRLGPLLGRGAMSVVMRATNTALQRDVAIKFLSELWSGDQEARGRFLSEARVVARLEHPNAVRVFDVVDGDEAPPYMVMEFIEGTSLQELIRRGALAPRPAMRIARGVLSALHEAHAAGIIHRDIKPSNVIVADTDTGADRVKVLDFGVSKVLGSPDSVRPETAHGAVLGTPGYMPPEQVRSSTEVDARSDLWAVGVLLFEMLSGRTPFLGASSAERTLAVLRDKPLDLRAVAPDAPEPIARIVARCLESEPLRRYQSAEEMAAEVDAWLASAAVPSGDRALAVAPAARESRTATSPAAVKSPWAGRVAVAAGVVAALGGGFFGGYRMGYDQGAAALDRKQADAEFVKNMHTLPAVAVPAVLSPSPRTPFFEPFHQTESSYTPVWVRELANARLREVSRTCLAAAESTGPLPGATDYALEVDTQTGKVVDVHGYGSGERHSVLDTCQANLFRTLDFSPPKPRPGQTRPSPRVFVGLRLVTQDRLGGATTAEPTSPKR